MKIAISGAGGFIGTYLVSKFKENSSNGVAFRNGALAEINRIIRFDGIEKRLANPDGYLFVPVGAPCQDSKFSHAVSKTA